MKLHKSHLSKLYKKSKKPNSFRFKSNNVWLNYAFLKTSLKFGFYTQAVGLERPQGLTSQGRDQDPQAQGHGHDPRSWGHDPQGQGRG